eukprot:55316-Karenia_brevis.AAC.1
MMPMMTVSMETMIMMMTMLLMMMMTITNDADGDEIDGRDECKDDFEHTGMDLHSDDNVHDLVDGDDDAEDCNYIQMMMTMSRIMRMMMMMDSLTRDSNDDDR